MSMTRNILGLHLQGRTYEEEAWLRRSMEELRGYVQWIWLMNPSVALRESPFPNQKCGIREFPVSGWDGLERLMVSQGREGAHRWMDWVLPRYEPNQRWAECLQGPNEVAVETYDQRMQLNEFAMELYKLCMQHGIRLAFGGCLGVGWPGGESGKENMDWIECTKRDAIQLMPTYRSCDYVVSHHYGKRSNDPFSHWDEMEGWTLRYRIVQEALDSVSEDGSFDKPRLITEGGFDQCGDKNTSGWRGPNGPSRGEYVRQVMVACDEIAKDKNVECYLVFTAMSTGWPSFRIEQPDWEAFSVEVLKRDPYAELPDDRPLPTDELAVSNALVLSTKTRWWCEEAKRKLVEGEDTEYGMSIVDRLPDLARAAEITVHTSLKRSTLPPDVSS